MESCWLEGDCPHLNVRPSKLSLPDLPSDPQTNQTYPLWVTLHSTGRASQRLDRSLCIMEGPRIGVRLVTSLYLSATGEPSCVYEYRKLVWKRWSVSIK